MSSKYNRNYKGKSVCRVINGKPEVIHDCFSTQFPNGLRVLLVDDDPICLVLMESLIRTLDYKVTSCQQAKVALEILRENRDVFDIAVIDIHMPDMNGIELLQHVQVEADLPVVMISADDKRELVLEGVLRGACDYLIKPVTLESLKTIWQHVLRKKGYVLRRLAQPRSNHEGGNQVRGLTDSCSVDHRTIPEEHKGNPNHLKRKRDDEFEDECKAYSDDAAKGKRRMVWTPDLHKKFLEAVNYLGDKAVPMKILECMQRMNIPDVTRENIASHLQKYRLNLRKVDESSEQKHQHHLPSSSSNEGAFFEENLLLGRRNFKRAEGSSRFPMQSLITGTRFPLQDQSSASFHSIPQSSYYPPLAVSFPPHNFPCINSTEAGASSNSLSPFVISTPTEEPENGRQGNIEQHSQTLPVFDFDGTEGGDTLPQLIDEPSLCHRYFDKNEFFPEPGPNDVVDQIDLTMIGNRVCDSPTETS